MPFDIPDFITAEQTIAFLTDHAKLSSRNVSERQEDVLAVSKQAVKIELLETSGRSTELLNNAMNSFYYIYDANYLEVQKLHASDTAEELVEYLELILYDTHYNVRHRSKF